jgi:hypothetical protein
MRVRYIPRAQDDVDEIYESIAANNPDRAQRVEHAIRAARTCWAGSRAWVSPRGMKMRDDGRCPNTRRLSSIASIGKGRQSTCCASWMHDGSGISSACRGNSEH